MENIKQQANPLRRKLKPHERKQINKYYAQHLKMGLPKKKAWTWAWMLTMLVKDHWGKPKGGW